MIISVYFSVQSLSSVPLFFFLHVHLSRVDLQVRPQVRPTSAVRRTPIAYHLEHEKEREEGKRVLIVCVQVLCVCLKVYLLKNYYFNMYQYWFAFMVLVGK